jgi:UDP-N-acetylglucosamine enolpyruvyl transferase
MASGQLLATLSVGPGISALLATAFGAVIAHTSGLVQLISSAELLSGLGHSALATGPKLLLPSPVVCLSASQEGVLAGCADGAVIVLAFDSD